VAALSLLVLLAVGASNAGAQPSGGNFCSVSRAVARNIAGVTKVDQAATPATLKATWGAIAAAEPALKASATGSIKANLLPVLAFVNVVVADLKKVDWQVTGLAPYGATLLAGAQRIKPNVAVLDRYYRTTCHLHV
jgi:hypothetical protein